MIVNNKNDTFINDNNNGKLIICFVATCRVKSTIQYYYDKRKPEIDLFYEQQLLLFIKFTTNITTSLLICIKQGFPRVVSTFGSRQ